VNNWSGFMHKWECTTLGAICESTGGSIQTGPFGSQLHASDYVKEGIPSVMPKNIGDNRIIEDGIARVSATDIARLSRYLLRTGDIVYSRRGDVERRALVRHENDGWLCGTGCLRVRIGVTDRYDSRFVSYALGTAESRQWIKRHAVGATMLNLNTAILSAVPLTVPTFGEQQEIAEVLGALDDKIAADDRACRLTAELALSEFLRAVKTAAHVTIEDAACMVTRGVVPKYVEAGGLVLLNQKCIRNQIVNLAPARLTASLTKSGGKLLQRNDVLVNSTGQGTLGRVARWLHDVEAVVDTHISIVRFDSFLVDPVCAGYALLQLEGKIEGLAEGSTGQTELRRELLAGLSLAVPERRTQVALGKRLTVLDDLAMQLRAESQWLAEVRDELLPLLMSGRIRVRDAEKVVEEVV
jgi:type I restriction enzyme S subunit